MGIGTADAAEAAAADEEEDDSLDAGMAADSGCVFDGGNSGAASAMIAGLDCEDRSYLRS